MILIVLVNQIILIGGIMDLILIGAFHWSFKLGSGTSSSSARTVTTNSDRSYYIIDAKLNTPMIKRRYI